MTDQPEDGVPAQISSVFSTLAGLVSLGFGLLLVVSGTAQSLGGAGLSVVPIFLFAVVLLAISAVTLRPIRRRLEERHSMRTFGRTRRVERRIVDDETHGESCVSCGDRVIRGVERRYREEFVVAGIPLIREEVGYNSYCLSCVTADDREVPEEVTPVEYSERTEPSRE